ncbi:MAG: hypothetical protein ACI9LM_002188 [Alteromonadaceae bacterium]|jgi:hypothetical protein
MTISLYPSSNNLSVSSYKRKQVSASRRSMLLTGLLSLYLLTTAAHALSDTSSNEELGIPAASVSHGGFKKAFDDVTKTTIIEQNHLAVLSDQIIGKATGKSRAATNNINEKALQVNKSFSKSRSFDHDFGIYSVLTFLEDDLDGDGYYQTFSVSFDADVYSSTSNYDSEVYAELYLSKDGVNWLHYYSTDNFIIHANTDEDEYEVITTLLDGYKAGHYDVLIDLYEVGYDDIVATYRSDDNDVLPALALESSDFDRPYVEEVHIYHNSGGSTSVFTSLFIVLIAGIRLLKRAD